MCCNSICPETGLRSKIFLATKFGYVSHGTLNYTIRNDAEWIHQQFQASLERLQTDYVDLYYVHRTDPNVPIEETMEILKDSVKCVTHLSGC